MVWGFCVYFVYMKPLETDFLRKHLLHDEEPFAISMMQPDIAVKGTISCNRFLSLYFSLLLNITRRTINAALSFCHKREEDAFSCGLLMFSRPL